MLGFVLIHLMIGNVLAILWLVLPLATWLFRKRLLWIKGSGSRWSATVGVKANPPGVIVLPAQSVIEARPCAFHNL